MVESSFASPTSKSDHGKSALSNLEYEAFVRPRDPEASVEGVIEPGSCLQELGLKSEKCKENFNNWF
jgi:hypothetical protein